jgi:hypothetical protein
LPLLSNGGKTRYGVVKYAFYALRSRSFGNGEANVLLYEERVMAEKENFMKVINGKIPAWPQRDYFGGDPYSSFKPARMSVSPSPVAGSSL